MKNPIMTIFQKYPFSSRVLLSLGVLFLLSGCGSSKWSAPKQEEATEWKFEEVGDIAHVEDSVLVDEPLKWDKSLIRLTKREFRGVWLTTLENLDWPEKSSWGQPELQKATLDQYFDLFQSLNINVVFFQIRANADAFYESAYEPWSEVFTGKRGQPAGWDPIRYAIEAAHARGIQLHAWMNPYRIQKNRPFDKDLYGIPAELVKDYPGIRMYNPGLPAVRERIVAIVNEVLSKYPEVDGIHFDDYFYPSQSQCGGKLDDSEEFRRFNPKGLTLEEWRYDNVNQMIQMVDQAVHEKNPNLIFSISPGANTENNRKIYADVPAWCENGWVDVIIPQLYWDRTFFDSRLDEFCSYAQNVPLVVGFATYKFSDKPNPSKGSSMFNDVNVFQEEYELANQKPQVIGGAHFRAYSLLANKIGIQDKVREVYATYRLAPYLGTDSSCPATPTDLHVSDEGVLTWSGDGVRFAIYKDAAEGDERGKKADLVGVTSDFYYQLPEVGTYYITALDRYNAESVISDRIIYQ